ncbi:MAG: YjjG family noncanonical pyrimidine nucleotidase [Oscillospiraceae bacterium]|nr:YjjG family noncanonical pyrimidine nucleotidase [Oscillospiraceae bacterium]
MLSKYDIILFDSDNTLYSHDNHEKCALFEAFKAYGVCIDEENYLLYRNINSDVWREFERGITHAHGPLIERFMRFSAASDIELSPERINSLYIEALSDQCSPFAESSEVCRTLSKKHTLYIITNGTESVQLKRYERSPLRPFFSGIFTAAGIGVQKPKEEFFRRVFEKIGNPEKSRVIIIGDSLTSDILGGVNCGIDTCWYNPKRQKNTFDFSPTYEIENLKQLL